MIIKIVTQKRRKRPPRAMKLTHKGVDALKPAEERYDVWEANGRGLGIRVSTKGRKTWIYMYRCNGVQRRMSLGRFPAMTLAQARDAHRAAETMVDRGEDPLLARRTEQHLRSETPTVGKLITEFLDDFDKQVRLGERSSKTAREYRRVLIGSARRKTHTPLAAVLGARLVSDVEHRDIEPYVRAFEEAGHPIMARRALRIISSMFAFGIPDYIQDNPCARIKKVGAKSEGDRVLSWAEIGTVWKTLTYARCQLPTQLAVRLLLATGQRVNEVAQARWEHFDLDERWWTIPRSDAKNSLPHRVWLSPLSRSLVLSVRDATRPSEWLFPSRTRKTNRPISETSLAQAVGRSRDVLAVSPFDPLSLRRTAASRMTSIGIPRLIVGIVLNHKEGGVTRIYDRYGYDAEKRAALNLWSASIQKAAGSQVEVDTDSMERFPWANLAWRNLLKNVARRSS